MPEDFKVERDDSSASSYTHVQDTQDRLHLASYDMAMANPSSYSAPTPELQGAIVPLFVMEEFVSHAERILPRLDTNADNFVSDTELGKAVQDPNYVNADAVVVAGLYAARNEIKELHDDEYFTDSEVTFADLKEFRQTSRSFQQDYTDRLAAQLSSFSHNFNPIDEDQNGFLSRGELRLTLLKETKDQYKLASITALMKDFDRIQNESDDEYGWENDGITKTDLETYLTSLDQTPEAKTLKNAMHAISRTMETMNPEVRFTLYGTSDATNSITADAIKQGNVGDCAFLASLASLAETNPQRIAKMITDNRNGTFTVTFPGAKNEPIVVDAPTQAEAGLYNGVGKHGAWALVMEKAFGKYCQNDASRRVNNPEGGNTPAEGGNGGAFASEALKLLTGLDATEETISASHSQSRLASNLHAAVLEKRAVTVSTVGIAEVSKSLTEGGFFTPHEYSVVGFKPDGKGGGMVTIRNPWGRNTGDQAGTMQVPLMVLMQNFSMVTYERK